MINLKKFIFFVLICSPILLFGAEVRLKNVITIKGVRSNPLIGYGLVIGLNGTGDGGGQITTTSLKRMFGKLGLNVSDDVSTKNVAAVIVTGTFPPFARMGQKIDVTISSIGDASSLAGGTLLITPLKGGDGEIYAVASGPLSIGGMNQGSKFATTARIPNGATVEKEIKLDFDQKKALRLSLNYPDFTTAHRIQTSINTGLGGKYAIARDSGTIDLMVPPQYQRNVVELVALIENYMVYTDTPAKIIINEKTGTIVAGGEVQLRPLAMAHRDLSVEIVGEGAGKEGGGGPQKLFSLPETATLNDLVKSLNALGASAEDLIAIFQALKQNGSLIGEIEFI